MMYPFMTLNDNTEIVHSETMNFNGKERVKVYIETPTEKGFKSAVCWLPSYQWEDVEGYSFLEKEYLFGLIWSMKDIIINLAKEGGIGEDVSNIIANGEV